jgi:Lecithin retinol acyltransferase
MSTNQLSAMFEHLGAEARTAFSFDTEPALGTQLVTLRSGYEHHGIYVGNGRVIHYAGFAKSLHRGPVEEISFEQFAAGHDVSIRLNPTAKFVGLEAVRRAQSRLGEDNYRLLTNNCEHFCTWCLFGVNRSQQVEACFASPRVAMHTVAGLFRTFIEAKRSRFFIGAQAA